MAEALSELGFAAEQSGANLETLEAGLKAMQRNIVSAAGGSREMRATLAKLEPKETGQSSYSFDTGGGRPVQEGTARPAAGGAVVGTRGQ
jgi:hypothetical protein